MNERDLFYGSRIISRESPSGMKYPELPKVRMISICNFHVRTSSTEIVEPIQLVYKKGPREVATDALEIYHIQLPEFRKRYKTIASVMDDPLLRWLYFFESGYKSEEETEMLAQTSEGMREIVDRYGTAIMDPVLISRYDAIEDARREEASRLAYARREAAKEAAKETNRKNAKGFKERGFDPKAIAEVCGLTLEEVEAL